MNTESKPKKPEIYRYVRDERNNKIGILLANLFPGGIVSIGWSKCKTTGPNRDTFTRERGLVIARGRAAQTRKLGYIKLDNMPQSMWEPVARFSTSAHKYYGVDTLLPIIKTETVSGTVSGGVE